MNTIKNLKQKFSLGVILLIVFFSVSVIGKPRDIVRIGLEMDITSLNILEFKSGTGLPVFGAIYESLTRSPDYTKSADEMILAKSIELLPSGKDIKIRMKKGHRFHTGDPVTAEDIKFTIEQVQDPQNANTLSMIFDEIEEVEIIDDYNLIIHLYESYAPWPMLLNMGVVSKKYYEKVGREKFRVHPIGSGPFRFVDRKPGKSITLQTVRNDPNYNVNFKTLEFVVVKDPITRIAMLEAGELDLITQIQPHSSRRLKRKNSIKVKSTNSAPSLFFLNINQTVYPSLKDKNLKLAINHAINRKELVKRVYLGEGYPIHMWANILELGYDPIVKYKYDPVKAKKLLKKSNYKPGTPLSLIYNGIMPNSDIVATVIRSYLGKIGLTVKLKKLDWDSFIKYSRTKDKRAGHLALSSFASIPDPQIRMMLSVASSGPFTSYSDRSNMQLIDELILRQSQEIDVYKRKRLLKRIHKINYSDPANAPLFGLNMIYAMNKQINYTWIEGAVFPRSLHEIVVK